MLADSPITLMLRLGLGTIWAGVLCLTGIMAFAELPARFAAAGLECRLAGIGVFALGQFVFAVVVADRLFPRAAAAWTWPMHLGSAIIATGCLTLLFVRVLAL